MFYVPYRAANTKEQSSRPVESGQGIQRNVSPSLGFVWFDTERTKLPGNVTVSTAAGSGGVIAVIVLI